VKRFLRDLRVRSAALFALVTLLWAVTLPRMRVDMSIAHFLPESQDKRAAGLLRSLAESEMARVTVIHLSGGTPDALLGVAKTLLTGLRDLPTTKEVRSGFDDGAERALFEFFASYPPSAFLPVSAFTDEAIEARVRALKSELAGPLGPVVRLTAPRDPLGATFGLLRLLREEQGVGTTTREGILITNDGAHAFLFLTTIGNAFDADTQRASFAGIERVFTQSNARQAGISYELAGVGRHTVESEQQIRGDIQRIGTLSTLGVLLLFAFAFRSIRMLLLGLVPLLFGTMVATLGCYLLFGSVHGLTLVFGTSLLGVGIDYAEHYYAHFALEPEVGAVAMMRRVWPGLFMGATTTIIGLAGLAWADFPGAVQMAVFSTLAVAGALVGTRLLLPPWMPDGYRRPAMLAQVEEWFARSLEVLGRFRRWPWVPLVITAVVALGLVRISFIDDLNALLEVDPALTATEDRVRTLLTEADPGRFAVVLAKDEERLGEDLEKVEAELAAAKDAGLVARFTPLGALLRSPAAQREARARAIEKLPVLRAALEREGFRPEAFRPYEEALEHPARPEVTLADTLASPIGDLVRPLSFVLGDEHGFVLPLGGVRSVSELRAAVPHALIADETSLLADTYGHVRARVMSLIGLGLVFVFAILFWRYRDARLAASAMVPAILAAIATTATFGWIGAPLNIFHAIGLALVLSMGVDYGIFVVEGRESRIDAARSLVSVLTATVTTILSFGMLAISSNPALRALGGTIALGMTLAFVLSPSALVGSLHKHGEAK
jgi:predicted exporter